MTAVIRGGALHLPLRDESVDLVVTSPPYFALRSYQDGGEHYDGQIGSEATPQAFLEALWAVTAELQRVLKPSGSMFVNLGDKYAGSGGHNNAGISDKSTLRGNGHVGGVGKAGPQKIKATRRSAPDAYNKATIGGARPKSLMGLPWRYANGCVDGLAGDPLILRAEIVWSKPNGLPESVGDRVRRSHEQWFHLTREGDYFSAVDEIREPYAPGTAARYAAGYNPRAVDAERPTVNTKLGGDTYDENPLGKLPGSVWTISSEPLVVPDHVDVDHFAAFPQEWPRRLILGWTPSGICLQCGEGRRPVTVAERVKPPAHGPGSTTGKVHGDGPNDHRATDERFDKAYSIEGYACACPEPTAPTRPAVVLDPFGGTGTTAMVARALGRVGISVDLSADYCRLARWRIFESGHAAKSRARTDREAQGTML